MENLNMVEVIDTQKESVINEPVFWVAIIFYTLVIGLGFLNPIFGLIGLGCIAIISILKIIFKNFALIAGMIGLGVICAAIPFLLIVYIPILIYFFIARLGYFLEHRRFVLVGLVVYFFPTFILMLAINTEFFLFFLIIPIILFPIAINYFYKNYNYTVEKILELFSEAPILIISIILPFLKLGFSVGETPVAIETHTIPDGHSIPTEAITTKSINPIVASSVNDVPTGVEYVNIDPVTPLIPLNHISSTFNLDDFYNTLSHSHQLFDHTGSDNITSFGDRIQIGMGVDQIVLVKDTFHLNILDGNGSQIGTIENNTLEHGVLNIKDINGIKAGEVQFSQEQNTIIFKDTNNMVVASLDQPSSSDVNSFIKAEIDKTQVTLDQLERDQISVDSENRVEQISLQTYQNNIGLIMLSILAKNREINSEVMGDNTAITSLKVNDDSLLNTGNRVYKLKPIHSITFAKYIEENCSDTFRENDKIFLYKRLGEISNEDWKVITEKYNVDKEDVVLVASTAMIYVGSNGFLITKDDVVHARELRAEPVRYHLSQIAGIKKGGFTNEKNCLDSKNIFVINFDEFWMGGIFKELNDLFIKYRKLS